MAFLDDEHKAEWLKLWNIPPEQAEQAWAEKVAMHRGEYKSADTLGDIPGYVSPVTGKWIEGKRARRDDLARSGSRPWEGMEQEQKEAQRRKADEIRKADAKVHEAVARAFYSLPVEKQRLLSRG